MCRISESSDGDNIDDNDKNDDDEKDDIMSLPPPPPPADGLDDVYIDIEEDDEVYKNGMQLFFVHPEKIALHALLLAQTPMLYM